MVNVLHFRDLVNLLLDKRISKTEPKWGMNAKIFGMHTEFEWVSIHHLHISLPIHSELVSFVCIWYSFWFGFASCWLLIAGAINTPTVHCTLCNVHCIPTTRCLPLIWNHWINHCVISAIVGAIAYWTESEIEIDIG